MKKNSLLAIFCLIFNFSVSASTWAAQEHPKLVVLLVIDQFRADYLTRFESRFQTDGFNYLMHKSAYFPFGQYDLIQSITAPGHATTLTGAYPYQAGIPLNQWFNRSEKRWENCVEDRDSPLVGKGNLSTR